MFNQDLHHVIKEIAASQIQMKDCEVIEFIDENLHQSPAQYQWNHQKHIVKVGPG